MSIYVIPTGAIECWLDSDAIYSDTTSQLVPFNGSTLPSGFWNGLDPNASGTDFFFCDLSGVPFLHNVSNFNIDNRELACWIKFPSMSTTEDTHFLVQWGSGNIITDEQGETFRNLYGGSVNAIVIIDSENVPRAYPYQRQITNKAVDYVNGSWRQIPNFELHPWLRPNDYYPQPESGLFGSGLDFGQSYGMQGQAITFDDHDEYDFTTDGTGDDLPFTMMAVYKWNQTPVSMELFGKRTWFDSNQTYRLRTVATKLVVSLGPDNGGADPQMIWTESDDCVVSGWNSVAATYDASATPEGIKLYASGVQRSQTNHTFSGYDGIGINTHPLTVFSNLDSDASKNYIGDTAILLDAVIPSGSITNFFGFLPTADGVSSINISGVEADEVVVPINYRPTILTQPADISKNVGEFHTFTVDASGATSYQWQKDESNITGETSSGYFDSYISPSDSGSYRVACVNQYGTTWSSGALLTVTGAGEGSGASGVYAGSAYYVSGYIDAAMIAANDINVPVPMGGSGMPEEFWTNVYRSDGKDIVVTDMEGVPFKREIVSFDASSKELRMWVKFPALSATVDTRFLVQYGATELNYPNDSVFNGNYTGDFDHSLACHFRENPNDSSNSGHTFYGITSDAIPVPTPLQYNDLGQIDKSLQINYSPATLMNAYTQDADDLSFVTSSGDAPFTMRTWMRPRSGFSFSWDGLPIMQKGKTTDQGEWYYGFTGTKHSIFLHDPYISGTIWGWHGTESDASYTGDEDTWKHLACTYDGNLDAPGLSLYENGSPDASTDTSGNVGGLAYSGMVNGYGETTIGVLTASGAAGYSYTYAQDVLYGEIFIIRGELTANQMTTQHQLESTFNDQATIVYSDQGEFDTNPYEPPASELAPVVTVELVDIVRDIGDSATYTVEATGDGILSYAWAYNGATIIGEVSPTYTLGSVQETSGGTYAITITNSYGTASSSATLSVVGSSGIIPTGVLPADPGDYVFIDKNYTGVSALNATNIYNMDIGNLFFNDEKADRFLFGNLKTVDTTFSISVSGVNTTVWENLTLSTDRINYSGTVNVSLEHNEIAPVFIKYDVEDNPALGYGTLLLVVGEV